MDVGLITLIFLNMQVISTLREYEKRTEITPQSGTAEGAPKTHLSQNPVFLRSVEHSIKIKPYMYV